jgi:hypothetical protein
MSVVDEADFLTTLGCLDGWERHMMLMLLDCEREKD